MKIRIIRLLALVTLFTCARQTFAQGTAFTYQGKLNNNGSAVTGLYDFQFRLATDSVGSNHVGSAFLTNGVGVTNGLFTVTMDFGAGIFTGVNLWLQTDVRTNGGGGYTALTPLQSILPTPYAVFAKSASNVTGTISSSSVSGTYANAVTLNNSANQFTGAFTGNGGNLTNVNAATLGGISSAGFWRTNGNSGANPTNGAFIGTTDNFPFQIKINSSRVSRFEPGGVSSHLANGTQTGAPNIVNGAAINLVSSGVVGAVIAGGGATNYSGGSMTNSVATDFGTIGGGAGNVIQTNSRFSTIAGGDRNTIYSGADDSAILSGLSQSILTGGTASVIAGGDENVIQSATAGILSGFMNTISTNSNFGIIGGGKLNTMENSTRGFIGNGVNHHLAASDSFIGAGSQNEIQTGAVNAVITGGGFSTIESGAQFATIGGGNQNLIQSNAEYSVVSGGTVNTVRSTVSVIGGGNYNTIETGSDFSTIGGGTGNQITADSISSVIAGGDENIIRSSSAAILGGFMNEVSSNSNFGTIVGGKLNSMSDSVRGFIGNGTANKIYAWDSFMGAGSQNTILGGAANSVITGGGNNTIESNATHTVISGGSKNLIQSNALYAVIGGGSSNKVQQGASSSVIGGGGFNVIQTNAHHAMIVGGYSNVISGNYSLAAGYNAQATNSGAFVWSDGSGTLTTSTNANSMTLRASGGYRLFTAAGSVGAFLPASGTAWATISDQNEKKNRAPVDNQSVLEKLSSVPVEQWNYKWESDEATPNIGPMAQAFKGTFYPGRDDKSITTLEFDGVELAAIKGLNEQLKAKDARIADLETRLQKLEELVSKSMQK